MAIKRYSTGESVPAHTWPVVDGEAYVHADDYDALQSRLDAAERARMNQFETLNKYQQQLAERDALLRELKSEYWHSNAELPAPLINRIDALLSSAEPAKLTCERCHGMGTAFTDYCEKCEPAKGGDGEGEPCPTT